MIKKHWLLKTDNQTITQTEKQGNIKLKLCKINHIRNPRSQKCTYIMRKDISGSQIPYIHITKPRVGTH